MKKKIYKKQQNSVPSPRGEESNPVEEWFRAGRTKLSRCQEDAVLMRGYTMIEVMVVIAIIGIMSGVMLVLPSTNKSEARLRTAQREVVSAIKLAQTYALQGRAQTPVMPCGYGFRFTNTTTYEIFYNLPEAGPGLDCESKNSDSNYTQWRPPGSGASDQAESFSLKNNVTLSFPSAADLDNNNTEIYFTIPHANMYNKDGMNYPASQTFTFNFPGTTKTITVNPGGYVEEN